MDVIKHRACLSVCPSVCGAGLQMRLPWSFVNVTRLEDAALTKMAEKEELQNNANNRSQLRDWKFMLDWNDPLG